MTSPTPAASAAPSAPLTYDDRGSGRVALILHGGGGPGTVAGIAAHLAGSHRVVVPTHPGWNGTVRPDGVSTVADLADLYLALLTGLGLEDALVVGSSLGGWIGAEMAARDTAGRIGQLALVNAVGVDVAGEPITDFFGLDARGIAEHSWHDSERYYVDPATVEPVAAAAQRANMAALRVYAGDPYMHDPTLLGRLGSVTVETVVLWGESDRVVTAAYGRAYAAAFGDGRFELVAEAGHLPHIERPEATFAILDAVAARRR